MRRAPAAPALLRRGLENPGGVEREGKGVNTRVLGRGGASKRRQPFP